MLITVNTNIFKMAIIGHIDGVPLFDEVQFAENYGAKFGLTGYHTHTVPIGTYSGQTGYMAGADHNQAMNATPGVVVPMASNQAPPPQPQPVTIIPQQTQVQQPLPQPTPQPNPTPSQSPSTSGGSSGGGGY